MFGALDADALEPAALAQLGAHQREHVEDDADAGQIRTAESATGKIRIDDRIGVGHFAPGQMMIGDDHRRAGGAGRAHAFDTRNAVVDRHQHVGMVGHRDRDDLRASAHNRTRTGSAR